MQYQKIEIRQNIIKSAKEEFLKNGYNSAKISVIAAGACVPVGNLYRYFDGKNGLFEAVAGESYLQIPQYIDEWIAANIKQNKTFAKGLDKSAATFTDILTETLACILTDGLLDLFERYGEELLILADKSEGSKYQDFGEKLYKLIHTYIKKFVLKPKNSEDEIFCLVVSNAFLNMMLDILRNSDKNAYKSLIKKVLRFMLFGINEHMRFS